MSDRTKVDIVMRTYNSNKRFFPSVLASIRRFIPMNRLIVVDKNSSDGTTSAIRDWFPHDATIIETPANAGYALRLGIQQVETDWFAVVDDDVIILPEWFTVVQAFIEPGVGGIETGARTSRIGNDTFRMPAIPHYEKWPIKKVSRGDVARHGLTNLTRGYTASALIQRRASADWAPNRRLGAYEDYSLSQFLMQSGYRWVVVDLPLHVHLGWRQPTTYSDLWTNNFRKGLWHGSNLRYVDLPIDYVIINAVCRTYRPLVKLFMRRDPQIVSYLLESAGMFLAMATTRFEELKR